MVPNEFWIVVTQYEGTAAGYKSDGPPQGPCVFEGRCLTEAEAIARAKQLGTQYGWVITLRVVSEGGRQTLAQLEDRPYENKASAAPQDFEYRTAATMPAEPPAQTTVLIRCRKCGRKEPKVVSELCNNCEYPVRIDNARVF